ncbi:MAG: BREX system ATP-binding domain-containing protein [Actinomycetota bacterium]
MTAPLVTGPDVAALSEGRPPLSPALLAYLETPSPGWCEFLRREYLADFIAQGGAKLKLLIGTTGAGKSHLLRLSASLARDEGYVVAELEAFGTRLFPIDRLYGAVVRAVGLDSLIDRYALKALADLGLSAEQLTGRGPYLDRAVQSGLGLEMTLRRSFHERVDGLLREGSLDPTFAGAVAQAVGHRLGVFHLSEVEQDALRRWFLAEKVRLSELKSLQLYERPDRYNARDYLRSLAAFGRLSGATGLVVCIDNLETVTHRSPATGRQRYTRAQRDEAFEAIRQLIDDVDRSAAMLFLLAARREFLDDEKAGISSYEALRLRLLQEVRADRFNPYADIVDLDFARQSGYISSDALTDWQERLRECHPGGAGASAAQTIRTDRLSLRELVVALAAAERES